MQNVVSMLDLRKGLENKEVSMKHLKRLGLGLLPFVAITSIISLGFLLAYFETARLIVLGLSLLIIVYLVGMALEHIWKS